VVHIFFNVTTENSFSVDLGVVNFFTTIVGVSRESSGGVGNVETSVASTLKATKDSVTSGGSDETDVQNSLEWSLFLVLVSFFDIVVFTIDLGVTSIEFIQTSLVEESSGNEETSSITSSIVGQTSFKAILLEFSGVSVSKDLVTLNSGIDNLADNSGASNSGNKSVFGRVVFVFVLDDQSLSGVVISLTLSSSSESSLESLVVSSSFVNLDEGHF